MSDLQSRVNDLAAIQKASQKKSMRLVWILNAIGIVALIISILLPSLNRIRETTSRVPCSANLKSIGQGLFLYSWNHGGKFPDTVDELILSAELTPEVFTCPKSGQQRVPGKSPEEQSRNLRQFPERYLSYVYVGRGLTNKAGSDVVLAYEPPKNHSDAGTNLLYADGHVDWESKPVAQKLIAELEAGHNPPRDEMLK